MNLRRHLVSKDPTGKRKPGALVWVLVFAAIVVAGYVYLIRPHRQRSAGAASPPAADVSRHVNVGAIEAAAESSGQTSPGQSPKSKQLPSDRGSGLGYAENTAAGAPPAAAASATANEKANEAAKAPPDSGVGFESLNALMTSPGASLGGGEPAQGEARSKDGRPQLDEGGQMAGPENGPAALTPAYVATGADNAGGPGGPPKLPVVDFAKLTYTPGPGVVVGQMRGGPARQLETSAARRTTAHLFLPRGEKIQACLLDTVQSGNLASYIELAVLKPVYFDGDLMMPFGARLVGAASVTGTMDRMEVSITAVRFMDRMELPIKGIAKDSVDGATGIRAYYIPPPTMVQLAPYLNDFLTAFLQAEAMRLQSTSISVAGLTVQQNSAAQVNEAAVQAASEAITSLAAKQIDRLQNRYQEQWVVPIGTKCVVQLTSNFDAGPLYQEQPIETAVAEMPLPIRPNGTEAFPVGTLGGANVPGAAADTAAAARKAAQTAAAIPTPLPPATAAAASEVPTTADFFGPTK